MPAVSVLDNGLPPWNAVTFVTLQLVNWGIPYLFGRLYFDDLAGLRTLALGVVAVGLASVPLIAFEVAAHRSLCEMAYGIPNSNGYKHGLYSPVVNAEHQLDMGIWAAIPAVVAFWLWCTGAERRLLGLPFVACTAAVIAGSFLCHQTGAAALTAGGLYLAHRSPAVGGSAICPTCWPRCR